MKSKLYNTSLRVSFLVVLLLFFSTAYTAIIDPDNDGMPDSWELQIVYAGWWDPVVAMPSSISVPSSDSDGTYSVSWDPSSTSGVTYELQEATNSNFTSELRTAYTETGLSTTITGSSSGVTYYYRVRATKSGYNPSSWQTGANVR